MSNSSRYYTTYSSHRFPFVGVPDQRTGASTAKDQLYINFYASEEKTFDGPKLMLEQRAGLVYYGGNGSGNFAGVGRGIYGWQGSFIYAVNNTLYANGTALQALSTSTGAVGFVEFGNDVNQKSLIVLDGVSGWIISPTLVITKITSPNFPSPHSVHAAYMDGYLVVAKAGTGDLYNCDLNSPSNWTAGNFISAEAFPDNVVALVRQNNYIVAIGEQSTEFFYDAGNSPGTPLATNRGALQQFGTPAPDTVCETEEQVIFVGQSHLGGRTVWLLEGLAATEIGCESLRESLDYELGDIITAKAFCIRSKGHKFYVLNLANNNETWVYDFGTKMWHQWADYTGANRFNCDYATEDSSGKPICLDRSLGYFYVMTEGVAQDSLSPTTTANITCIAISDKIDFGTMNHKFMHRLALVCDVPYGNNQTSCTLSWTDDDYQTYSTPRVLTISNTMPVITQLGMFRRRAFKLVYSDAYPIRIEGFEVDINNGSQ